MKRFLPAVCLTLLCGFAHAQTDAYIGLGLSGFYFESTYDEPGHFTASGTVVVQIGAPIAPSLGIRNTFETAIFHNRLSLDLLYDVTIQDNVKFYLGLGPDLVLGSTFWGAVEPYTFDVHGTGGVEYRFPYGIGVFAEAQPLVQSSLRAESLLVNFRTGLNLHF